MEKVVTFRLGGELFCIDISRIREIIRPMKPNKVPDTPDYVEGVIDLRGVVLPIIDLRKRFGFEPEVGKNQERIIVVEYGDGSLMGFVVDAVENVVPLTDKDLDAGNIGIKSIMAEYIRGIARSGDELVTVLDVDKIIPIEEITAIREKISS